MHNSIVRWRLFFFSLLLFSGLDRAIAENRPVVEDAALQFSTVQYEDNPADRGAGPRGAQPRRAGLEDNAAEQAEDAEQGDIKIFAGTGVIFQFGTETFPQFIETSKGSDTYERANYSSTLVYNGPMLLDVSAQVGMNMFTYVDLYLRANFNYGFIYQDIATTEARANRVLFNAYEASLDLNVRGAYFFLDLLGPYVSVGVGGSLQTGERIDHIVRDNPSPYAIRSIKSDDLLFSGYIDFSAGIRFKLRRVTMGLGYALRYYFIPLFNTGEYVFAYDTDRRSTKILVNSNQLLHGISIDVAYFF